MEKAQKTHMDGDELDETLAMGGQTAKLNADIEKEARVSSGAI